KSVVIVIGKIDAHTGKCFSIFVVCSPELGCQFSERAVAVIAEELLRKGIVGDGDVGPSVPVEIVDGDTQSFSWNFAETTFKGNVLKGAVAVVVEDQVSCRWKLVRMTITAISRTLITAVLVLGEVPVKISGDDQVKMAVAIVVDETCA